MTPLVASRNAMGSVLRVLLLCALLFCTQRVAAQVPTIHVGASDNYELTNLFSYMEDPGAALTITDVLQPAAQARFSPVGQRSSATNFGFSSSAYWLKATLRGEISLRSDWLIEVAYPPLDHIDLYVSRPDGQYSHYAGGNSMPFARRSVSHRNHVAPIRLDPGNINTVYLRIASKGNVSAPVTLWQAQALWEHDQKSYSALSMYFGLWVGMLLINSLLYASIRDKTYLVYVCFIFFVGISQVASSGLGTQFLWTDVFWWNERSMNIAHAAGGASGLWFVRSFLRCKKTLPKLDRLLWIQGYWWIIAVFASFLLPTRLTSQIISALAIIAAVAVLLTAALSVHHGHSGSKYFLVAWGSLMVGVAVQAMHSNGLIPSNAISSNSLLAGSAIEMVIHSIALAERISDLRRKKEAAQRRVLLAQITAREYKRDFAKLKQNQVLILEQNEELDRLSKTDSLTGLSNRWRLDAALDFEMARCERQKSIFSLILLDIDHFKRINDAHGHQVGDQVLIEVSKTLSANIRKTDLLGRWGGEEFLIICNETAEQAQILAEKLRAALERCEIAIVGHGTASFGISSYHHGDSIEAMIARADAAMYRAKLLGRNRVEIE